MAFATSNVQSTVFGNLKVTYGQWSGAQVDTVGTIGVAGGQVWACLFVSQDSSGEFGLAALRYTTSTSGSVTTVSIYNFADVTAGRFIIIHS